MQPWLVHCMIDLHGLLVCHGACAAAGPHVAHRFPGLACYPHTPSLTYRRGTSNGWGKQAATTSQWWRWPQAEQPSWLCTPFP
jgi:hypothetical protein